MKQVEQRQEVKLYLDPYVSYWGEVGLLDGPGLLQKLSNKSEE
jgi:hypothetical protein